MINEDSEPGLLKDDPWRRNRIEIVTKDEGER